MMLKYGGMAAVLAGLIVSARADGALLYDGTAPGAPSSQGWLSHYSLFGGTETVGAGKTTYDAGSDNVVRGGYSSHTLGGTVVNAAFPALNRAVGYTVSVDLKELSEAHATNDRSGVSLIALSSDALGIELGFWQNEIWAQSGSAFTHAEGAAYDTTAANATYDLSIVGSTYTLYANGAQILTGPLRDYSSFGSPYNIPSYVFLGDDTGSGRGSFEFSRMAVSVPEPTAGIVLGLAPLLLRARRGRK